MGMLNALGRGPDEIWPRLLAGDQSHFRTRDDLVPGRSLLVAEVAGPLPTIPARLARFACRNNALSLAVIEQLEDVLADVIRAVGRDRVGIVMGTSTSGVGDAELAIRHRHQTGTGRRPHSISSPRTP